MPSKVRRRFDSLVRRQRKFVCQSARILETEREREQERTMGSQQTQQQHHHHHNYAAATNWHTRNALVTTTMTHISTLSIV